MQRDILNGIFMKETVNDLLTVSLLYKRGFGLCQTAFVNTKVRIMLHFNLTRRY